MTYHPIMLDKARNFKYGMRAVSLIEKKLKLPITKIDTDNMTMEEQAIFVWAGLIHEDQNITPDSVMDMIDEFSNVRSVMTEAGTAFLEAFPVPEKDDSNDEESYLENGENSEKN